MNGYDDYSDYGGGVDVAEYGPVRDWYDNGDGTHTDLVSGEIWQGDELIGFDLGDGSGNWVDLWGDVFDAQNNPISEAPTVDDTFEYDPALGMYFDKLTGYAVRFDEQGNPEIIGSFPDGISGGLDPNGAGTNEGGFFSAVGNFFSRLFAGGGAAGPGGGGGAGGGFSFGGGGSSQQAAQRAQNAQQQLAQAQARGNVSPQQLAQLQQQLMLAQAVAARVSGGGDTAKTLLVAGGVALGVALLMRPRRD